MIMVGRRVLIDADTKDAFTAVVERDVAGGDFIVRVVGGQDNGKRFAINRSRMTVQDEDPNPISGVITKDQ